ncbi:MAG: hypothetical protein AB7J28_15375 [Hyphomonadaceae bacterium]
MNSPDIPAQLLNIGSAGAGVGLPAAGAGGSIQDLFRSVTGQITGGGPNTPPVASGDGSAAQPNSPTAPGVPGVGGSAPGGTLLERLLAAISSGGMPPNPTTAAGSTPLNQPTFGGA